MKRITDNGDAVEVERISITSDLKVCPICGCNRIKERKKFESPDLSPAAAPKT